MRLFIPTLGTVLTLIRPWKFSLHAEHRNLAAYEHFKLDYHKYGDWRVQIPPPIVEVPMNAKLKLERYYIKKGAPEYDSITFSWQKETLPLVKGKPATKNIRFWVKLADANTIEFAHNEHW